MLATARKDRDLCFIDVETTGARFGYHELIEIAAVRCTNDGAEELGVWSRRVVPQYPERATPEAMALNGFELGRWHDAERSTRPMWEEFVRFARGSIAVCHNPAFDRAFITLAASACGISSLEIDHHWIGTESLAWPLYKSGRLPGVSLSELCAAFEINSDPVPHRALAGAQTCRSLYRALLTRIS